jgi:hypothetical protein
MNEVGSSTGPKTTNLEELHSEMNAGCVSVGNLQITRPCCTSAKNDCIISASQVLSIDIDTNARVGNKRL